MIVYKMISYSEIMDCDFEPDSYRYTIEQFVNLNPGSAALPPDLSAIFQTYTMPACSTEQAYNNKHNIRFYPPGVEATQPKKKAGFGKKAGAYSDSNILGDLRHALSSVVKGNDGTVLAVATLGQILIPSTMIVPVAGLFYDTMIQSPKQMPEYLTVLFNFRNGTEQKIYLEFVKLVMNNFITPIKLEDTPLEGGTTRTRKHRDATCKLLALLYTYKFDDPRHAKPRSYFCKKDNLRNKLLIPLFTRARDDPEAVKNLASVWEILIQAKKPLDQDIISEFKPQIKELFENKSFKLSIRLLLRDFIKE